MTTVRAPVAGRAAASTALVERLLSKIDKDGGCWLWTGYITPNGYGTLAVDGRTVRSHRVAYELFVGPIPDGLQIDHLCRVRHCVNPDHLEPVTNRVNTLRGDTIPAAHARRTHCKNGHEFTPENTSWRRGHRDCRRCERLWNVAAKRRARARRQETSGSDRGGAADVPARSAGGLVHGADRSASISRETRGAPRAAIRPVAPAARTRTSRKPRPLHPHAQPGLSEPGESVHAR